MAGGACLGSDGFAPRGKLGDMGPPIEVAQRFLNRRRCNMSARGADKGKLASPTVNLRSRPSKGGVKRYARNLHEKALGMALCEPHV